MPADTCYLCRSPAQKRAKAAFDSLLADTARADAAYDALPDSQGGKIISTDLVRELDRRYARRPRGKTRDLAPSWDGAWRYAQARFVREITARNGRRIVRFMAGGWAAGKTHALRNLETLDADLVWDGTLGDVPWAIEIIRRALEHGWWVQIFYVHRNIELALYGAIVRAFAEGREVPLDKLPAVHREVQSAVRRLVRAFAADARVSFTFLHNTGVGEIAALVVPFEQDELARGGPLYYSLRYEAYYQAQAGPIHHNAFARLQR